jgi:hypothetical protein
VPKIRIKAPKGVSDAPIRADLARAAGDKLLQHLVVA